MRCIPPCVCEIHGVLRARFRAVRWVLCVCLYMQISMLSVSAYHMYMCVCLHIFTASELASIRVSPRGVSEAEVGERGREGDSLKVSESLEKKLNACKSGTGVHSVLR
eukprot:Tamp_29822.p2 GENE.Tamp_29822~~Tamp_29822.p2  ORF type:complete len:108 (+),score=1.41 Tamp_29822:328-651(+)